MKLEAGDSPLFERAFDEGYVDPMVIEECRNAYFFLVPSTDTDILEDGNTTSISFSSPTADEFLSR